MSADRGAELLWPFRCCTCHDQQLLIGDVQDPRNFHIVHRCSRCGYLNVLERSVLTIPFSTAIRVLHPDVQEKLQNDLRSDPAASLRHAIRDLVNCLDDLVAADPSAAAAALLLAMLERERALTPVLENQIGMSDPSADLHAKVVSRATDLLYLLLHRNRAARLPEESSSVEDIGVPFLRRFSEIASDAATMALHATGVETGLWSLEFQDNELVTEKTELHSRLAEWDLNRREFENLVGAKQRTVVADQLFTKETMEAQRLVLGFDSTDLLQLSIGGFETLRSLGALQDLHQLVWAIDVGRLEASQKRLLDALTFTRARIHRFAAPFYFDLGIPRQGEAEELAVLVDTLGGSWWANYYPLYELVDEKGKSWLVTTKMPFLIFLGNLGSFKNRLFQRIIEHAGGAALASDALRQMRQLEKRVSRRLEDVATNAARAQGWITQVRLKKWRGERLQCGDIDLLAAKRVGEDLQVVLAEVKDFDITLVSRRGALQALERKIGETFDQLGKKVEWVRAAWAEGLRELVAPQENQRDANLLPIVITARYMPPFMFDRFLGIPVDGLGIFLDQLAAGALSVYRLAARESLVRLGAMRSS